MVRTIDERPAPENAQDSCVGYEMRVYTSHEVAKHAYRVKKTEVILTCESVEDLKERVRDWYDDIDVYKLPETGEKVSEWDIMSGNCYTDAEHKLDRWDGDEDLEIMGTKGDCGRRKRIEIFCCTWTPSITWSTEVSKTPTVKAAGKQ